MKTHTFDSRIRFGETLPDFSESVIKAEPQLFSAELGWAWKNGGPITRSFLSAVGREDGIFDSRVSMLMPGWWPCIPGYHHDDVPRDTPGSQPNYDSPAYLAEHAMALVGAEIAPTRFALGRCSLVAPLGTEPIYGVWHRDIMRMVDRGEMREISCPDRTVVFFDWQSWHNGTRATRRGWRWFGRLSWNTKRPVLNEVRTQTNIYVSVDEASW